MNLSPSMTVFLAVISSDILISNSHTSYEFIMFLIRGFMNIDAGFLVSLDTLGIMKRKCRRLIKAMILGENEMATIGSWVTIIDCADSQPHEFRLVEAIGPRDVHPKDLPIDSSLGLALFGSRPGDYIKLSVGGEESGIVILSINNEKSETNATIATFDEF